MVISEVCARREAVVVLTGHLWRTLENKFRERGKKGGWGLTVTFTTREESRELFVYQLATGMVFFINSLGPLTYRSLVYVTTSTLTPEAPNQERITVEKSTDRYRTAYAIQTQVFGIAVVDNPSISATVCLSVTRLCPMSYDGIDITRTPSEQFKRFDPARATWS